MTQGQAAQFTGVRAWQGRSSVSGSLVYDGKIGEAKGQGGREGGGWETGAGGRRKLINLCGLNTQQASQRAWERVSMESLPHDRQQHGSCRADEQRETLRKGLSGRSHRRSAPTRLQACVEHERTHETFGHSGVPPKPKASNWLSESNCIRVVKFAYMIVTVSVSWYHRIWGNPMIFNAEKEAIWNKITTWNKSSNGHDALRD